MPTTGLSRPYVADYFYNGAVVTYQNGIRAGRAVSYSIELNDPGENDFYADNVLAETDSGRFTGGTLNLETAELGMDVSRKITGCKVNTVTINGQQIQETVMDDDANAPNLGYGIIEEEIVNGVTQYTGVILSKIKFNTPSRDATTRGEQIEWQTSETTAKIMRDDTPKHAWQMISAPLESEAQADKYIRSKLNMPIQDIGILTVNSAAGSMAGTTVVSVTPTLTSGNHYMYLLGNNLELPYYEQTVDEERGFVPWDGTSEITPGIVAQEIMIVEVDANDAALAAGIAMLVVNEIPEA